MLGKKNLGAKNKGGSTRNKGELQPPEPPPPSFLRHCSSLSYRIIFVSTSLMWLVLVSVYSSFVAS